MTTVIGLFFLVLVLVLYHSKPEYIMIFYLISTPVLIPIILKVVGINDFEGSTQVITSVWAAFYRAMILIYLFRLCSRKVGKMSKFKRVLPPFLILIVFYLLHYCLHFSIAVLYENITTAVFLVLPFLLMYSDKRCWPKMSTLFITLFVIYAIQAIWIPLNIQGIYAYAARPEIFMNNPSEALMMAGTFLKSNQLADFVSITYLFICVDYFYRRQLQPFLFYITSVLAFILVIFSGSKTPAVLMLFSVLGSIFIFQQNKRFKVAVSGIIALALIFAINQMPTINTQNEGFNRLANEISTVVKVGGNSVEDESTLRLSTKLIEKYFMQSPLIGNGQAYKGDNAYPINDWVSNLTNYKADATVAYTLVEFGLIGFFLMLFYYYRVIDAVRAESGMRRVVTYMVFLFFLLFSITESGLFYNANYAYMAMYFFAVKRLSTGSQHKKFSIKCSRNSINA